MTFPERCDLVRIRAHRDAVTREVDELIAEFMRDRGDINGALHVCLDDSDWSDETLDRAAQVACNARDADAYALARLFLAMRFEQRMRLAAVCDCGCTPERYRG